MTTWLETTDGATPFEQLLRTDPPLFELFRDFVSRVWSEQLVDPVVLELCRLRIAQLHKCESELRLRYQPAVDAGLTEEKIGLLPRYYESDQFSEHERASVALAEQFAIDAHLVSDEDFAKAADGIDPSEMMAFVNALAVFDGTDRMRLMLGVQPAFDEVTVVPAPTPEQGPIY